MKSFSSADLYFLKKELEELKEGRIESFYFEDSLFYIKIFNRQKGHSYLTCKLGSYLYISEKKHETSHPNPFVSYLRKYLKNAFVEDISIIPGERILVLTLSKKDKESETFIKYHLVIEIFSPGNVILLDSTNQILNTLTKKNYKDRIVKNKEQYLFPPQKNINFENLELLEEELKKSELSIVVFLATEFGIGSKYAEEIVSRLGFDKKTPAFNVDSKKLKEIIKIFSSKDLNPQIQLINNEVKDFFPFKFNIENLESVSSFNYAISRYYSQFLKTEDKKEKDLILQLKKLEKRLKKQEAQKEQMLKDYDKYSEIGNKIYENYSMLEEVLTSINNAAKQKGWDSVIKTISTNDKLSFIKKVDYKNNKIEIELE